ncbi:MAG: porin [Nitrospinales bacterium]
MKRFWNIFLTAPLTLLFFASSAQAGGIFKVLEDIEIHGFASSSYSYNFNEPVNPLTMRGPSSAPTPRPKTNCGATGVCLRIADQDDNSFNFDYGELVFLKDASKKGEAGFRFDLAFGFQGNEIFPSARSDPSANSGFLLDDDFDVQQAYVTYNVPIGNGIVVDMGKFITHVGAELIDGYDGYNYNYSRSYLFGLAIPFTHTGIKATYAFNDMISVMGMVANGWDIVTDNNDFKTYGVQVAVTPTDNITVLLNWAGGAEGAISTDWRNIFDIVIEVGLLDNLTVSLNADYGFEEGVYPLNPGEDAEWWGVSGIVRYDFNNWLSLNVRATFFDDNDGYRTFGTPDGLVLDDHELWAITVTPEFRVNKNMVVRAEYRHDGSNLNSFYEVGTLVDSQDTLALNALVFF